MSTTKIIDAEVLVSKIVTCPACGKKNRIKQERAHGYHRCGACHSAIQDQPIASPRRWPILPYPFRWALRRYFGWIAAVILGVILCFVLSRPSKDSRDAFPRPKVSAEPEEPPIARSLPTGTIIRARELRGSGKLTIENGTENDAVLKLVDQISRQSIVEFYVGASSSYTIGSIPDGSYNVYFATGVDWDPLAGLFTNHRRYSRFTEPALFNTSQRTTESDEEIRTYTQTAHWSFTLHQVVGGNAKADSISEQEFLSK